VENFLLHYQSLHVVKVTKRVPFDHDWNKPSWSLEEIKTILKKFKCDYKAFTKPGDSVHMYWRVFTSLMSST
jgi:hypothetical protein